MHGSNVTWLTTRVEKHIPVIESSRRQRGIEHPIACSDTPRRVFWVKPVFDWRGFRRHLFFARSRTSQLRQCRLFKHMVNVPKGHQNLRTRNDFPIVPAGQSANDSSEWRLTHPETVP